jgi:hypothetical protein
MVNLEVRRLDFLGSEIRLVEQWVHPFTLAPRWPLGVAAPTQANRAAGTERMEINIKLTPPPGMSLGRECDPFGSSRGH